MTYETALEKIHSLLTFGSRPGLDRMRALLHRMGDPQDKLRYAPFCPPFWRRQATKPACSSRRISRIFVSGSRSTTK